MNALLRLLTVLSLGATPAYAGPLQQAAINQIVNDVKVVDPAKGARPAALKDTIKDDLAVKTGQQSRAELLFQDNTLTRLGAETFFSFNAGTRDLSLERGTMLLQVPKGLGGARIRTASVTASITGTTIMMEYLPSKSLKVLVLEGSLRLSPNGRFGEGMLLTAGRMVIMKPDAKRIPEPVEVDLRKVIKTSSLIDSAAFKGKSKAQPAPLPSLGLIQKEIAKQDTLIKDRSLVATNLVIAGSGTTVLTASDDTLAALDRGVLTVEQRQVDALLAEPALPVDPVVPSLPESVRKATDSRTGQLASGNDSLTSPLSVGTDAAKLAVSGKLDKSARAIVNGSTGTIPPSGNTGTPPLVTIDLTTGAGTGTGTGIGTGTAINPKIKIDVPGSVRFTHSDPNATQIDFTGVTDFHVKAKSISFTPQDFTIPASVLVSVETKAGGVNASQSRLVGFDSIKATGGDIQALAITGSEISGDRRLVVSDSVSADKVDLKGAITVGGALVVTGDIKAASVDGGTIQGGKLQSDGNVFIAQSLTLVTDLDIQGAVKPRGGFATDATSYLVSAKSLKAYTGLQFNGSNGALLSLPAAGGNVTLHAESVVIGSGGINGAVLDGGAATTGAGGAGGNLQIGTSAAPIPKTVTINSPISASSGTNGLLALSGGDGGSVAVTALDEIKVEAQVKVSDSAAGKQGGRGGHISLESRKTTGNAITVNNSGQLLALLSVAAPGPGGTITFLSAGGDISVNGGTVQADRGTVDIRNNGTGNVTLTNANLRGDVVKVGALGPNGQLTIGGGTINADTMLKLYGGTSNGEVRFKDNVTLGGAGTKVIAGKTVTIDGGKTVTVGGNNAASVFTDRANYTGSGGNGSTSGIFGGAGATTSGYNNRPGF